ncbi:MAG: hypothetical protein QM661_09060 [Solimonas sp.]
MSTPRPWPPLPRSGLDLAGRNVCRWLEGLALLHIAGGLALPFAVLYGHTLDQWLPQLADGSSAARFWSAAFGPTIASWGLLAWFLVRRGLREGRRWAGDALIYAILTWLPLDLALCFGMGYAPGIVVDLVAALAMLLPLLWLRPRLG